MLSLILYFILIASPGATSLLPLDIEGLIHKSSAVIHAEIRHSESYYQGGHIWTRWNVKVLEYAKGSGPNFLSIVQPGGRKGVFHTQSSGTTEFRRGQEYCLFIWTDSTGLHQVLGFSQGSMKIIRNIANELTLSLEGPSTEVIARSIQKISGSSFSTDSPKQRAFAVFTNKPTWGHLKALIKRHE
jgi:hypothetical protein